MKQSNSSLQTPSDSSSIPSQNPGNGQGQSQLPLPTNQPFQGLNNPGYLLDDNMNGAGRADPSNPFGNLIPVEPWNAGPQPNPVSVTNQYAPYVRRGPSDDCGCSSSADCLCLGCATHPDNATTVAHVNDSYHYLEQPDGQSLPSPECLTPAASEIPAVTSAGSQFNSFYNHTMAPTFASPTSPVGIGGFDELQFSGDGYFGSTSTVPTTYPLFGHHQPPTPQSLHSGSVDSSRQTPYANNGVPLFQNLDHFCQNTFCRCHVCVCDGCNSHRGCFTHRRLSSSLA